MFKKIEIWVLYLVIILSILFSIAFGVLVRQEIEGKTKLGNIDISFLSKPAASIARLPEQILTNLIKQNPNRVNDPWEEYRDFFDQDGFKGTPNDQESFLLLSRYDGNLSEGIVELYDLTNFKLLHTWNPDINSINNLIRDKEEFKYIKRDDNDKRKILMHPLLHEDGGLFFGWGSFKKIDHCSDLIFQNSTDRFHHSIEVDIDGNLWVPSRIFPQSLAEFKVGRKLHEEEGFIDDGIAKISPNGKILYEKSISQIFIDNDMEYLLFSVGDRVFVKDPIHLNDIQPVDFDGEFWQKGDIFLSLRNQSMVLLYRPSSNRIIWKGTGPFFHQHDVDILNESKISIFNNNSKDFVNGYIVDGNNEVIIYDFKTNEYSQYLSESLVKSDVKSLTQGRSQILPNNDLYFEESTYGRTLYFNADGSIRWTHVNKAKDGNIYGVGWSRILYTQKDLNIVKNFLLNRGACNE